MTTHLETKLEIKSWDEKPHLELPDGRKFARANVVLSVAEDGITADATWEAVLFYRADGTGSYVGQMRLDGRLGGRTGSFVLEGSGTYDGTEARVGMAVVPGSGTGDLAGLRGGPPPPAADPARPRPGSGWVIRVSVSTTTILRLLPFRSGLLVRWGWLGELGVAGRWRGRPVGSSCVLLGGF